METDNYIYINKKTNILIIIYVDDFLIINKIKLILKTFKKKILIFFNIILIGLIEYFFGVRIVKNKKNYIISFYQNAYIEKIFDRFGITNYKSVNTLFALNTNIFIVIFKK